MSITSSSVIFANLVENIFSEIQKTGITSDNNRKFCLYFDLFKINNRSFARAKNVM